LVSATDFVTETSGGQPGLKLETFDNDGLSGSPKSEQVVRRISNTGFSWDSLSDWQDVAPILASAPNAASRRWSGYYVAKDSGSYELAVQGPGEHNGFRVYIDDRLVFDSWELAKAYLEHATLELASGPHKIVVEDVQRTPFGGRLRLAIASQRTLVSDAAKRIAAKADAVVVAVGFNRDSEGEGADRTFSLPIGQDELIHEMAAQNKNVIVSITSGGAVNAASWIEQVPACLELWYPGEQGGTAFGEVLFGDVNPSGRLPISFEKREEDNPTFNNYYPESRTRKVLYKEGVFVGYRGYEHSGTKPLFPFGFGLSYAKFGFSHLTINNGTTDGKYVVSFDISNAGGRIGAEVAQVYVADSGTSVSRPPKELKGFVRINLKPGETQRVQIELNPRSFAFYDTDAGVWRAPAGTYKVLVGQSSAQIELTGEVKIAKTITEKP
jgi:beta-glucosidase